MSLQAVPCTTALAVVVLPSPKLHAGKSSKPNEEYFKGKSDSSNLPTTMGSLGLVTSTKLTPSVKPTRAYSLEVSGSTQPQMSLTCCPPKSSGLI